MSELIHINDTAAPDLSRREILRGIALALTAAGVGSLDPVSAQHVHEEVKRGRAADGTYTPQLLTEHEFNTVKRLAELIVPADEKGPECRRRGRGGVHRSSLQSKRSTGRDLHGRAWVGWTPACDSSTRRPSSRRRNRNKPRCSIYSSKPSAPPAEADHAWGESEYADFRDYGIEERFGPRRRRQLFRLVCARCRSTPITPAKRACGMSAISATTRSRNTPYPKSRSIS